MIPKNEYTSPRQTVLSMVILSILIIIGAGIFIAQFRYNPAVLQKEAFLPEPDKDTAPSKLSPYESFVPLPEGIQPLTAAEIFNAGNLSDKINGKAELYLSAGFTRLLSQRFTDAHVADLWMEVFVYDMGNSQNAFSVFSTQRREDAEPLDLAQNAYVTSNALFLTHDRYYLEIIASKALEDLLQTAKMMAETFIRNTPSETTIPTESGLLPKEGLIENSISLIASNAFGYEGFEKIYNAEYEIDDSFLMAYLSLRRTPEEAKELASAYVKFLLAYGGQNIEKSLPIKDARLIKILDTYEIILFKNSYLAGVRDAATINQAEKLAIRLYDRINERDHEFRSER